jgi:ribosomal protein S18|tara:strand:+ start:1373 stop:1822 length:450 start_codon:yes stop_codon:yes gene_type:complete
MTATWLEGLDVLLDVLKTNWNRGNTNNYKPIVIDIAEIGAERGKRLDMKNHDYILVFETAHNEETPEMLYDFVTTRINITLDARTMKSRKHMQQMENEIRRCIHTKRKGDGANFDRLVFKTRTDLSDRSKMLFRTTFQIEVVIFAELIP